MYGGVREIEESGEIFFGFFESDGAVVFKVAADGGIGAGDDFVVFGEAGFDFEPGVVAKAGGDGALLGAASVFKENDALQVIAVAAAGLGGAAAGFLFFEVALFLEGVETFAVAAGADGDALNGCGKDVAHGGGLDVGGGAHAGSQGDAGVENADFYLVIRDFLGGASAGDGGGAGDVFDASLEGAIRVGVDADEDGLFDLDIDDVVFVHLGVDLHVFEIGDAQDLGAGKLSGGDDAFAKFAGKGGKRAVDGRINAGFNKFLADLGELTFDTFDIEKRGLKAGIGDVAIGFGVVEIVLGADFFGEKLSLSAEIDLAFQELSFALEIIGASSSESGFLLFDLSLKSVGFNFDEEIAFFHVLPFLVGETDDFAGNFGRDFDFESGLDFAGGGDNLDDVTFCDAFGGDGERFFAFLRVNDDGNDENDCNQEPWPKAFPRAGAGVGWNGHAGIVFA